MYFEPIVGSELGLIAVICFSNSKCHMFKKLLCYLEELTICIFNCRQLLSNMKYVLRYTDYK